MAAEPKPAAKQLDQALERLEQAVGRVKTNARPAAEVDGLKAQLAKAEKDLAAVKAERDKLAGEAKAKDAEIARLERASAEAAIRVDAVLGELKAVLGG